MNVIAQSETTVQKASRSSSFSWLYDISKWLSLGLLNIGKKKTIQTNQPVLKKAVLYPCTVCLPLTMKEGTANIIRKAMLLTLDWLWMHQQESPRPDFPVSSTHEQ